MPRNDFKLIIYTAPCMDIKPKPGKDAYVSCIACAWANVSDVDSISRLYWPVSPWPLLRHPDASRQGFVAQVFNQYFEGVPVLGLCAKLRCFPESRTFIMNISF